jgi:hypothetical protein
MATSNIGRSDTLPSVAVSATPLSRARRPSLCRRTSAKAARDSVQWGGSAAAGLSRGEKREPPAIGNAGHSFTESPRGEKRGFRGVKRRDSPFSRGEKRILLLDRLNYLSTSLRA